MRLFLKMELSKDLAYKSWEAKAVDAFLDRPLPDTRFEVMRRVCETSSMTLRVIEAAEGDSVGSRFELLFRDAEGKNESAGVCTMSFDELRAAIDAGVAPEDLHGDVPEGLVISPISENDLMTHLDDGEGVQATGFEELLKELDYRVVLNRNDESLPAVQGFMIAEEIDKHLMWRPIPESVKEANLEAAATYNNYIALARVLYKVFGEDVVDLVLAMLFFAEHEKETQGSKKLWEVRETAMALPADRKVKAVEGMLDQYEIEERAYEEVIKWALGNKTYTRLAQEAGDFEGVLLGFARAFRESSFLREKVLMALRSSTHGSDKVLTGAFLRQGWVTLAEMTREVTDFEWFSIVKAQIDEILASPEKQAMYFGTAERRERFGVQQQNVAKFFAENEEPDPSTVETLSKAIGCDELRNKLREIAAQHNPYAYAAMEHEICSRIVRYVSRYKSLSKEDPQQTWEAGFPVNVVKNKKATCFSGPMLIAMLMIRSGIPHENVFFCNVNESKGGMLGGHGSIIVRTRLNELRLFDHGMSTAGKNFEPVFFGPAISGFGELVRGQRSHAIHVEVEEDHSALFDLHKNMQVMPIFNGFASGHMLHVGLSFMAEELYEEAYYAFELGLSYSPGDPDLLHGIARIEFTEGNYLEAIRYAGMALKTFDGHPWARMTLAEAYLEIGAKEDAIELFEGIANEERDIYQGNEIKETARDKLEEIRGAD